MGQNAQEEIISIENATATGVTVFKDNVSRFTQIQALLDVTAVTGTTPTMDLTIEWSMNGTNWETAMTFTQATGVTAEYQTDTTPFGSRLRASYTIGGVADPDFTFTVKVLAKG